MALIDTKLALSGYWAITMKELGYINISSECLLMELMTVSECVHVHYF